MSKRADALALRIEQGAQALAEYTKRLSDAQWQAKLPPDGRQVGVIISPCSERLSDRDRSRQAVVCHSAKRYVIGDQP